MFDSLDEQIKKDDAKETTGRERIVKWILGGVVAILIFGGLYYGVHLLEGI